LATIIPITRKNTLKYGEPYDKLLKKVFSSIIKNSWYTSNNKANDTNKEMTVLLTDLHTQLISFINSGVNIYSINNVEINHATPLSELLIIVDPNKDCNNVISRTKNAKFFNIAINKVLPLVT
jgi:hypothetical protein